MLRRCNGAFHFWIELNKHKGKPSPAFKLKLLRKYARFRYEPHDDLGAARQDFQVSGLALKKRCFVCRGKAAHRHHIVQLRYGGINAANNITSLCVDCHSEVHNWMKARLKLPRLGVLHKPRDLTPRLVKQPVGLTAALSA